MKNYQMRLDFGEGIFCHRAYEIWLEETNANDSDVAWEVFRRAWSNACDEVQQLTRRDRE